MLTLYFLCFMHLMPWDCNIMQVKNENGIILTIDRIPSHILQGDTIVITGELFNGSKKTISLKELDSKGFIYENDHFWTVVICKEDVQCFYPFTPAHRVPKKIKIKKNQTYAFNIPITFADLFTIRNNTFCDISENGLYNIQVVVSLDKPNNMKIYSNVMELYLEANKNNEEIEKC